jgi:hypothetical protein
MVRNSDTQQCDIQWDGERPLSITKQEGVRKRTLLSDLVQYLSWRKLQCQRSSEYAIGNETEVSPVANILRKRDHFYENQHWPMCLIKAHFPTNDLAMFISFISTRVWPSEPFNESRKTFEVLKPLGYSCSPMLLTLFLFFVVAEVTLCVCLIGLVYVVSLAVDCI